MTMHIRDATVWKTASPKVRDAGVWKQVQTGSVRDAGVWKTFFNNASYSVTTDVSGGQEPFTVTATLTTTGVANGTLVGYQIFDNGYGNWNYSTDYNVSSYDNGKPSGVVQVAANGLAYLYVYVLNETPGEQTEYFYINFYVGGSVVAQTQMISVADKPASCIWALYGRPEWC